MKVGCVFGNHIVGWDPHLVILTHPHLFVPSFHAETEVRARTTTLVSEDLPPLSLSESLGGTVGGGRSSPWRVRHRERWSSRQEGVVMVMVRGFQSSPT
jgi:hypothetical protein